MKKVGKFGGGAGVLLATCSAAMAGDVPPNMSVKAPPAYVTKASPAPAQNGYDWNGWYIGVHVGVTAGSSNWSATPGLNGSFDLPFNFSFPGGRGSYLAGVQGGYNHVFASHVLLGVEADASFPNSDVSTPFSVRGSQTITSPFTGEVNYGEAVIYSGTVRARVGYAFDHFLLYGTGGMAWTFDQVTRTQVAGVLVVGTATPGTVDTSQPWRVGWAAGAGVEIPITGSWTAKAEYLWTDFGRHSVGFAAGAQAFDSDLTMQSLRVGLNYRIGDTAQGSDFVVKGLSPLETDRFAFHGQFTFLDQYDPPFRAPVSGQNSLGPNQNRETADMTLYAGVRLWQGAEAWINPEVDQGFGLSGTLGVAGFTSGEAYKVGADNPYARLQRAFFRQTINLGGETQQVDAGINQFSGTQTSDRLVLTIGKIGVVDIFDTNKYAHDPRGDFMNWSIVDTGTFDYAADAWGYTVGAAGEWYTGPWTFRAGVFDLSTMPNTTTLDSQFGQFQTVGEIERRYSIWDQPGKIAITGFLSRGRMGSFEDAIQLAAQTGGPAMISAVREYRSREGISMNLEQQLMPNVGFFARAGWANGDIEPYEFTDIDRTAAAGLSISGKKWGRDDDTFGIAGVVNGISKAHEAFLNAGGLGILVGDGQLPNPGSERILETYYSFPVLYARMTLDYQLIVNPAYNRDRGPASVFGVRLHAQY
jgi:high affinity Mn2+ porin